MNTLYKNENSVFGLSPLDIQNRRDSGLTKLTDKESANWLTGNYEIIDGVISEKAVSIPTNEEQQNSRAIAYADPTTGSDRLLKDYQGAVILGASDDVLAELKEAWETRLQEIKEEFPLS